MEIYLFLNILQANKFVRRGRLIDVPPYWRALFSFLRVLHKIAVSTKRRTLRRMCKFKNNSKAEWV